MNFFIISTLALISYLTLDIIFDDYLWMRNNDFTIILQNNTFPGEKLLFQFFSYVIQLPILIGGLQFMLSNKKVESILYIFLCIFGFTSNGLLKNAYHQPRPYWVEDEIIGIGCNMEFGKPSGHAQTSVIIYFSYLFIFYPSTFRLNKFKVTDNEDRNNDEESQFSNGLVAFLNVFAFLCIIMTGLSRVFLGVHSIGQVTLGWIYGVYIVLNYQIYCHEFLLHYIKNQLQIKNDDDVKFQRMSIFISAIFIFIIIIDITLLELNRKLFNQNEEEINKWLLKITYCKNKEIGQYTKDHTNVLYNACFLHGTLFSFIFSFILGCFFSQGSFNSLEYQNQMEYKTVNFKICRLMFFLPMLLPLPLLLIQTYNVYITAFLIFIPVIFIESWYITIMYPILLKKYKYQIKGEFLEQKLGYYEQLSQS
ncbi:unnamed protein product [Paramecium pentaurelia]|uniref:Phosphatidic acid phosphatase type 2/haloperoxidase domain-containing protein n=1 Tax=Paramecium pentaurelia TaxID=43138 RepID=A0A8S1YHS2_9CILI|nr:unnamed protein product [Paramecium pentaurelia]